MNKRKPLSLSLTHTHTHRNSCTYTHADAHTHIQTIKDEMQSCTTKITQQTDTMPLWHQFHNEWINISGSFTLTRSCQQQRWQRTLQHNYVIALLFSFDCRLNELIVLKMYEWKDMHICTENKSWKEAKYANLYKFLATQGAAYVNLWQLQAFCRGITLWKKQHQQWKPGDRRLGFVLQTVWFCCETKAANETTRINPPLQKYPLN